jgi:cytokinin dehydrogenase
MTGGPTRRDFVRGLGAGAIVLGFDPAAGRWISGFPGPSASASHIARVPHLDGQLLFDKTDLTADSDDFGHIVHHRPRAVLRPGSVDDIAKMVRFCSDFGILVAARGQGHSTFGQAQVEGGLVIEMATLDAVTVTGDRATAQAGARWSAVLTAALPLGLTPPVLNDYLELSIGGTLSAGGVGGESQHFGAQVDNVLELEVVTGAGQRVRCSPAAEPDLFHAVLAGLGQTAILVSATLRLVPATGSVRHYMLFYPTVAALTADQRRLVRDGRFSFLEGEAQPMPDGSPGWQFYIEAAAYFDTTPPDDATLIGDLNYIRGTEQIENLSYFDFQNRLAAAVAFLESTGEWFDPHPWWNVFLPDSATDSFVTAVMDGLTTADIGASGVILLYPLRTALLRQPLLRVPDEEIVFIFSILRTASPDTGADSADSMIAANGTLIRQVRDLGGFQYPIGSIPTSHADWRAHFGPQWPFLVQARRRFDPRGILTPGQGIFPVTRSDHRQFPDPSPGDRES